MWFYRVGEDERTANLPRGPVKTDYPGLGGRGPTLLDQSTRWGGEEKYAGGKKGLTAETNSPNGQTFHHPPNHLFAYDIVQSLPPQKTKGKEKIKKIGRKKSKPTSVHL